MSTSFDEVRETYRVLANNLPNTSIVMFDRDMRYLLAEGAFIQRVIRDYGGIVGKSPYEILPQSSIEFIIPIYVRILNGETFSFERFTSEFSYQSYASPIKNDTGEVIGGVIMTHDMTDAKRTEAALLASEVRFHSLVDIAPVGIIQTDARGKRIFCNTHWCEITGVTLEQALNDDSYQTIFPDDLDIASQAWEKMEETHLPFDNLIFRYQRPDGNAIWVSGNGRPIFDEHGQVMGYIGTVTNIDEQVRTQTALRKSEEHLRVITDNIQDIVTQHNADGTVVFASESCRTVLGYEPRSLIGHSTIHYVHPHERATMLEAMWKGIESGVPYITIEFRLRNSAGQYIKMESIVKFLFDEQSKYSGAVFISRDITERQRLQDMLLEREKLQTALDKEQELGMLKTLMMQRIGHEFRTPLTIIQSSSETLTNFLDRLTMEQKAARVDAIKRQIRSITDMLDQIGLAIYGTFKPNEIYRETVNISVLCKQAAAELEIQLQQAGKFSLDLPDMLIASVDQIVLKRAISNIMQNAARYSASTALVTVQLRQLEGHIELRVIDSGIGILPHEQSRIFEPFFRGSNINEVGGLGVGLTIAHAALEAHGGSITLESVPKHGTTVTLRFPLVTL
ncbi:MAG: PAS domain-containing sensor histidine kinase [Chloroflexi bacterium]|nr:PAS domain-containing sensor histidine kinase [Chloroflexota bacterium]MCC6896548.1 PAS domain-containing sensor histidine kinase [Anaerolineae bacterium]